MDLLEREGLVQRFAGRGTFVQNRGSSQSRWTLDLIEDLIVPAVPVTTKFCVPQWFQPIGA